MTRVDPLDREITAHKIWALLWLPPVAFVILFYTGVVRGEIGLLAVYLMFAGALLWPAGHAVIFLVFLLRGIGEERAASRAAQGVEPAPGPEAPGPRPPVPLSPSPGEPVPFALPPPAAPCRRDRFPPKPPPWPWLLRIVIIISGFIFTVGVVSLIAGYLPWWMVAIGLAHGPCCVGLLLYCPWARHYAALLCLAWSGFGWWNFLGGLLRGDSLSPGEWLPLTLLLVAPPLMAYRLWRSPRIREFLA